MQRYPPSRHLLRDLRVSAMHRDGVWCSRAPVVPEICAPDGSVRASFLATLIDVAGGRTSAGLSRPTAALTQEITLHKLAPLRSGEARVDVRPVRNGKTLILHDLDLTDAEGRSIGRATMSSSRIPSPPGMDLSGIRSGEWIHHALPDSAIRVPLAEYAGVRTAGPDAIELDLTPCLANGLGILHGASQALAVEFAAERAASGRSVTDLSVRYLSPGRKGPFRARAELLRDSSSSALARVELVDLGHSDALVAIGFATLLAP
jgi:acyl-coenzyme A thioesterase PaaI-like protein